MKKSKEQPASPEPQETARAAYVRLRTEAKALHEERAQAVASFQAYEKHAGALCDHYLKRQQFQPYAQLLAAQSRMQTKAAAWAVQEQRLATELNALLPRLDDELQGADEEPAVSVPSVRLVDDDDAEPVLEDFAP